jgi:hypothetical protein
MNWRALSLLPLLLLSEAGGAVVVVYRGSTPNIFDFSSQIDANFDINQDGVSDFRFIRDGGAGLLASFQASGDNRFISTLAIAPDVGGYVVPVVRGNLLGSDTTTLLGSWHKHTDNGGGSGFGLIFGPRPLQFEDAYIGVEFLAADGIHYGWIQYKGFGHPNSIVDGFRIPPNTLGGFIDSWAYESEPNKAIVVGVVPEPSNALLVAAGFVISCLMRRR